jgi:transposase
VADGEDPAAYYSDRDLAQKFKVSVRTIKRWRAKGGTAPRIELSSRTKRTRGSELNRLYSMK